jgi:hypothetical protein
VKDPFLRKDLERVDPVTDSGGLPDSLLDAIEADGGLWSASDAYTDAERVVERAREVGAVALRLDFRDLSLLRHLPGIRYLHLRSDGMPRVDPVSALTRVRALILETRALRGELDPFSFPDLRWLRVSLGGKGGKAVYASLERGHAHLEHLSVTEVPSRTLGGLVAGFPRLRHVRIHFADHLRTLGRLESVASTLRGLDLDITGIRSLEGIDALRGLQALRVHGGEVTDLAPLRMLPGLRYAHLDTGVGIASLGPLRDHPSLRILAISLIQDGDLTPLATMPELAAVGRGPRLAGDPPWPDLWAMSRDHPFRREWHRAMGD